MLIPHFSTRSRRSRLNPSWAIVLAGGILANEFGTASADNLGVVRDLASRVGPIVGSALTCQSIPRPRVQLIIDKFQEVIREYSSTDSERNDISRLFDRYVSDGRGSITSGKLDCGSANRQLADLEQSIGVSAVPSSGTATVAEAIEPTEPQPSLLPHGVTDREIRFGIVIPFSGAVKESGRQMKIGIDVAFAKANDAGGVNGRLLKLIAADDGYEPTRTLDAMKLLYDKEQVFGFIGNLGTPTAAVALPYVLEHQALFFAPITGASIVRHDPPDRYVFNYRPSYTEEADAQVRYLLKVRKIPPRQIAVFAQDDSFGQVGFDGVTKAFRALGISDTGVLKMTYKRNTVDVDDAVNQLRSQKVPIRAVVIVGTVRAAAKFIEKTRDPLPGMIYTNMSSVNPTMLADELMLLGPRFTENVIVTQTVPAVSGYSSLVLDYKSSLTKYFPGEKPDDVSLEGFIGASILVDALRRCGPQFDVEKLVDVLEKTHNLDLGLGVPINFGRGEHQAIHKVWGTQLDPDGRYQAIELE